MKIWVDGDSCPVIVKEILFKAVERVKVPLILVANRPVWIPTSSFITFVQVAAGLDVADNEIVARLIAGDLVITADIPLAAEVIARDAHALNPRGELYSVDTIRERLSMRDFMDTLRSGGVETGGPSPLGKNDRQAFANQLDRFLTRHVRKHPAAT